MARREADDDDGPERMCIATREVQPVEALIRFVAGPDGAVVPDLRRRLPGRGVWVSARRSAVAEAVRKKAFARGLKQPVTADPGLADLVERLLAQAARESISLANKAGQVVAGFAKVEAAIAHGVAAVIRARDAAPDGARKVDQALRRRYGEAAASIPVLAGLDSADLDLALGRPHVIHAALLDGPAAHGCISRCQAVERYRADTPVEARAGLQDVNGSLVSRPGGYERNE